MTTTDPLTSFGTNIATPQSQPVPGRDDQVKNNAGGYVFKTDPLTQLRRFLVIGTAGGTYYVGQDSLTRENGEMILALTKDDAEHKILVDEIVAISLAGRARKQNYILFALAIACQHGSTPAKQYARSKVTQVVRTGTHLFQFIGYLKQFGGMGRGIRRTLGAWYREKGADDLAYQLVKYRSREGWSHRDVLRLAHPSVEEPAKRSVLEFALKGDAIEGEHKAMPEIIDAFKAAQLPSANIPELLRQTNLPWEALPDSAMNDPEVWNVMLDNGVPTTALLRQLPRLTNLGLLPDMGGRTADVVGALIDPAQLKRARIHPIQVLIALKTYKSGSGMRTTWQPSRRIIDALDDMFYASFGAIEATGKRTMLAIDISGSMRGYAGGTQLTAAEVAGAMALATAKVEPEYAVLGFASRSGRSTTSPHDTQLVPLGISPRQRMDDVLREMSSRPFGGTDCALPMIVAERNNMPVDTFVVYTDNETWAGAIHPFQALKSYRKHTGIDAKLVVVGVTATRFTIADPSDPGMLDVAGFDGAVPQLIADFSAGSI